MRRALGRLMLAAGLIAPAVGAARAADIGGPIDGPIDPGGLACESVAVAALPSVWLGHFSGGYSHRLGAGLPIVIDWRDEKLCFPSRRSCDRYIRLMRRDFHRPEGYFTCLPLR